MTQGLPPQFIVAAVFTFVQNFSSSLLTNSLWPYLKLLDPSITESYFGYIVGAASVTGLLSNVLCGFIATKYRDVRVPLTFGIFCLILGNVTYLHVENFPSSCRKAVLVSRFLCGLSAGNSCLISTFVAVFAAKDQLPRAIALTSCGSTLGMLLGPAFQNVFTAFGYPGYQLFHLSINQYNAPALAAFVVNLIALSAVPFLTMDNSLGEYKLLNQETDCLVPELFESEESGEKDSNDFFQFYGYRGVPICLLTRFVQMFVLSMMDTIGASYTMFMFHWNNAEALLYGSRSSLVIGVIALLVHTLYSVIPQIRWTSHIRGCVFALASIFIYFLVSYPWNFEHDAEIGKNISTNCADSPYVWCEHAHFVSALRFYLPYYVCVTVAMCVLSLSNSTCLTLFAGKKYQGIVQSLQQISSYASTMVVSVVIGKTFTNYGPKSVWIIEMFMTGGMAVVWAVVGLSWKLSSQKRRERIVREFI